MKFGYGINYKNEGTLAHSLDRFYVVTKFILPAFEDQKFSKIKYDEKCNLQNEMGHTNEAKEHILDLVTYYRKIRPFVQYYKDPDQLFLPYNT